MRHRNVLSYYFPEYLVNGAIFSKMKEAPWQAVQSGLEMDIVYVGSFSGLKFPSRIISELSTDDVLDQQKLADILWKLYGRNWGKLWDAYMTEYDPIQNYNVKEVTERQLTNDRTIDKDINMSGSVDTTDNEKVTTDKTKVTNESGSNIEKIGRENTSKTDTETNTDSNENETTTIEYGKKIQDNSEQDVYTYGFNSSSPVPTSRTVGTSTEQQSGTDKTTRGLISSSKVDGESNTTVNESVDDTTTITNDTTETDNGTVQSTETIGTTKTEKTTDDTIDNQKENEEIIRDRVGNIGQNTYQELLKQEFELWKWNFYFQVFSDCDRIITIPVFGCDSVNYN